jgi:hypothetical protein
MLKPKASHNARRKREGDPSICLRQELDRSSLCADGCLSIAAGLCRMFLQQVSPQPLWRGAIPTDGGGSVGASQRANEHAFARHAFEKPGLVNEFFA